MSSRSCETWSDRTFSSAEASGLCWAHPHWPQHFPVTLGTPHNRGPSSPLDGRKSNGCLPVLSMTRNCSLTERMESVSTN